MKEGDRDGQRGGDRDGQIDRQIMTGTLILSPAVLKIKSYSLLLISLCLLFYQRETDPIY